MMENDDFHSNCCRVPECGHPSLLHQGCKADNVDKARISNTNKCYLQYIIKPASKYLNDVILSSAKNLVFSFCYEILHFVQDDYFNCRVNSRAFDINSTPLVSTTSVQCFQYTFYSASVEATLSKDSFQDADHIHTSPLMG